MVTRRALTIYLKGFREDIKEMSFVEIGKFVYFLAFSDSKGYVTKEHVDYVYGEFVPKYIDKLLQKTDAGIYKLKPIKSIDKNSQPKKSIPLPQNLEEVERFFEEHNLNIDPIEFYNKYQSNGWVCKRTGKQMKNWKTTAKNISTSNDTKNKN